jgi:hypothetical protein
LSIVAITPTPFLTPILLLVKMIKPALRTEPEPSSAKLLRPVDWLRGGIDRKVPTTALELVHEAFKQRLLFSNFNSEKLTELSALLQQQLRADPNDVCATSSLTC